MFWSKSYISTLFRISLIYFTKMTHNFGICLEISVIVHGVKLLNSVEHAGLRKGTLVCRHCAAPPLLCNNFSRHFDYHVVFREYVVYVFVFSILIKIICTYRKSITTHYYQKLTYIHWHMSALLILFCMKISLYYLGN